MGAVREWLTKVWDTANAAEGQGHALRRQEKTAKTVSAAGA